MKVTTLDEKSIRDIGHAFGYYDYGEETGMAAAFSGKEATANYICAYVRGVLRGGFLHTTSERGEGYIAYKLPKEKMGLKTMWPIACGMLHNSTLKCLLQFGIAIKRGGASLQDRMDKEKKPYIFVGLVCVREQYQGQGYMRKVLDLAFAEGDRLGVPVTGCWAACRFRRETQECSTVPTICPAPMGCGGLCLPLGWERSGAFFITLW